MRKYKGMVQIIKYVEIEFELADEMAFEDVAKVQAYIEAKDKLDVFRRDEENWDINVVEVKEKK